MKKKIIFMITKGNFGGAQRYVFDLATNLPKDKFEVLVALGEGETLEKKLIDANIRVRKIEALERNINFGKDFVAFFEIARIIREEKPNIVHLNSSKAGGLGALAVRLHNITTKDRKIKSIFTGHGWAFNEERTAISKFFIAILHWITIMLAHKTIAVSERIKEQIKVFPFVNGKISMIHNGTGPIEFISKEEAREKLVSGMNNKLWIGTIAELHKNKGLDYAIDAFAKTSKEFTNTIFVIIGEGEERVRLEKQISKLNLGDRVFLLGFKQNASTFLKAFDVATFTSRTEGFPYALLEIGLAGLPVVASWVGGIPEIIVNKESGILTQVGKIDEIEGALRELIKDEEKRITLGANLKERVAERFTLSKMLEETIRLYA